MDFLLRNIRKQTLPFFAKLFNQSFSVVDVGFLIDAGNIIFNGPYLDVQPLGNLTVRQVS